MSDPSDSIDLPGQLQALNRRLTQSNPELYRHVALYLQVLRQALPQQVRQACFHLATQVHPQRYTELPLERRQLLHGQIQELVGRCCSLLTVEHLVILAAQISRERQRRDRHDREQLLEELTWEGRAGAENRSPCRPDRCRSPSHRPWLADPSSGVRSAMGKPPPDPDEGERDDPDDAQFDDPDEDSEEGPEEGPSDETKGRSELEELEDSLWQAGRLPDDPERVLRWMDGMELALARRLRNLSHAINVELLRGGVSRSLLPVSLLDAVLAGQLETMAAPANLMRLPLPFPGARGPQAQTLAVLLRPTDLELEEPRLRTCRRRLQQHRQEVRRMAQQFRRLQRRLRIHQAEQLWLQDIRPPSIPTD